MQAVIARNLIRTCALAALVCSASTRASAQEDPVMKTAFPINDADPESQVPTPQEAAKKPMQMGYWVMLVSDRAEAAKAHGDFATAIKFYRAIAKAVPDRAAAFKRICSMYEALGDWDKAVASCQEVLSKDGVKVDDHVHYIHVLLSKKTPLTPAEISAADSVIAHVQNGLSQAVAADSAGAPAQAPAVDSMLVEQLKCELGVRLEDPKRLQACSSAMANLAPQDSRGTVFAFALALMQHDYGRAERLIADAKRHGIDEAGANMMRRQLQTELDRRPLLRRIFGDVRVLAGAGVMLLIAAWLVRRIGRGARAPRVGQEKLAGL